jgi:predicted nuclease of predicted toxin-antitoxin system
VRIIDETFGMTALSLHKLGLDDANDIEIFESASENIC